MTAPKPPAKPDGFHDECGVFGVFGHADAAAHVALGLHALQHRGQEASGIVSFDGRQFHSERALGLVGDHFNAESVMRRLKGDAAIGHNRYATTGETVFRNVQPLFAEFAFGGLAIGHNGNLTNARALRQRLVAQGCIFQSTTDTETIIHLIATSTSGGVVDRLVDALRQVIGAYSLVALTNSMMIGVRDPHGVRPLLIGELDNAYVLASETCALDIIGARFVRDVEPGEMVVIDATGLHSLRPFPAVRRQFCIFEYVYFARPDSSVEGLSVYETRKRIGAELAREQPADVDIVVPVPDSGVPAAIGFAAEAKLPFELGIIRNHYVGRTFIEPTDHIRHLGVRLKHNPTSEIIRDRRVVLIDDSIVRGTTSIKIVEMMRHAGAREVHMRIASPPTTNPCFYGIDTPDRHELMAANLSLELMRQRIGVDSLGFISIDGLYRAVGQPRRFAHRAQYCDACFTGDYPIALADHEGGQQPVQLSLLSEAV